MAFCQRCGSQIIEDAAFCGRCGSPVTAPSSLTPVATLSAPISRRSPFRVLLWIGAAFLALVIVLGLIAGGNGDSRTSDLAAIQAVRQQDSKLVAEMTATIEELKENSDEDLDKAGAVIKDYVVAARRIDTHACPRDFAESYYRSISAWSDEADAILAHPHIPQTQTEAFVNGFFRGWLYGDISGGQEEVTEWLRQTKAKHAEVNRTQEEVNALAVRYGAR